MFTGIVETIGKIEKIEKEGTNIHFTISSNISNELKIDQSVAHNGVCLTVIKKDEKSHIVTAVEETLKKTNLKNWNTGNYINLERCLKIGDRLDGHWVQGHVDTCIQVKDIKTIDGSWMYYFSLNDSHQGYVVPKGSVCINGVSLTVVEVNNSFFSVTIIPYTYEHTCFKDLAIESWVNIEWDILGKYILHSLKNRTH